jgi:IS605 OrfB family transposase
VRSITLLKDGERLYLDVTAELAVAPIPGLDPDRVAGVDIGIIHPFAAVSSDEALLVSGRALRVEERLHLEDTRARAKKMGRKAPRRKGEVGSRRWRTLIARQRAAERKHRRKLRQAHHEAARELVLWASRRGVGTLVVGHPKDIHERNAGRHHNRRITAWRRGHLLRALCDKAALLGIGIVLVDERGTSSTCPECGERQKPTGRTFRCKSCKYLGHRDLVGARNIAARGGGSTRESVRVMHRRAGHPPARRDRRRHLWDRRRSRLRSCPALGHRQEDSCPSRSPERSKESVALYGSCSVPATEAGEDLKTDTGKPVGSFETGH